MSLEQKTSIFNEENTDMQGEIRAGITTFLTMVYLGIPFVPRIRFTLILRLA